MNKRGIRMNNEIRNDSWSGITSSRMVTHSYNVMYYWYCIGISFLSPLVNVEK